jgi:16S rRNA (cytosine967-C5)-methyltransferase
VCAAPGGKALLAASRGASVTAVDAHSGRLQLLVAAAAAQGLAASLAAVHAADARVFCGEAARARTFDAVLVDAPCTGLGVLAKRADLRWRRAEDDLRERAGLQGALLAAAAALVKPGGRLVYSTCSTEPEENEAVVDAFLAAAAGSFELEPAAGVVRADGAPAVPPVALSGDGRFLAPLPHRTGTDAAFGARMRRVR